MKPLRVLHLFANYKWTGPADPAIRTAARLRALGHDVVFAQGWYCEEFDAKPYLANAKTGMMTKATHGCVRSRTYATM